MCFLCTALEESNSRIGQLEKVVDDYNKAQEDIAEQRRKAEELEMRLQETASMHEEEKARLVSTPLLSLFLEEVS